MAGLIFFKTGDLELVREFYIERLKDIATTEPELNERFNIYHFWGKILKAGSPTGGMMFQCAAEISFITAPILPAR